MRYLGGRALRRALQGGVLTAGVVVLAGTAGAEAAPARVTDPIPDRYIVVFKPSVDRPGDVARAQSANVRGDLRFVYRHALKGYAAELSEAAVKKLARDPRIAYIEPDARGGIAAQTTPTGVRRTFASANAALSINGSDDVRANVDVAVLDSGIDVLHPDLNVVGRTDCSNGATRASECVDGSGTDDNSHGTHVAGTIGAIDNGFGVTGIAPGARLWSVKVVDSRAAGDLSELVAGIDWVTAHAATIEVANASLRYFVTSSQAVTDAIDAAIDAGVVLVVAAGNENEAVRYVPGNHPDVITVSAVADYDGSAGGASWSTCENYGVDDRRASFSNYGPTVDIAAPGVCIYSTLPGNQYGYMSGTSMAAPHVAGAAALLDIQLNTSTGAEVEALRDKLRELGNSGWTDTSGDGVLEPLLDLSDDIYEVSNPECDYNNFTSSIKTGDINGDLKTDVYQFAGGGQGLHGTLSSGLAYTALGQIGTGFGSPYQDRIGDMDGDGDDDVFQVLDDGRVYAWTSDGARYTGIGLIGNEISTEGACEVRVLDMNGDGKDDLMRFSGSGRGYVWLSTGTGYTYIGHKGSGYGKAVEMRTADMDGDGDDDLLRFADNGSVLGWRSYGTGFTALGTVGTGFAGNYEVQIGDRDSDGDDDIFRFTDSGVGSVWQSDGSYYTGLGQIGTSFGVTRQMRVVDMNADGNADILKFADTGIAYGWLASGGSYSYLGQVGTGFGAP